MHPDDMKIFQLAIMSNFTTSWQNTELQVDNRCTYNECISLQYRIAMQNFLQYMSHSNINLHNYLYMEKLSYF